MLWAIVLIGCTPIKSSRGKDAVDTKPGGAMQAPRSGTKSPGLIVTPGSAMKGKIASVNPGGRFVVLSFPIGVMPPAERRLHVYRAGLKVGEVKITGPQRDTHTVADLVAGECQLGDEVRED